MTIILSVDIGIPTWETYIASFINPCTIGRIYDAGALKSYRWNLYQHRHPLDLADGRLKTLSSCECNALYTRVAADRKLLGKWIFNKFEYSGVVVLVV